MEIKKLAKELKESQEKTLAKERAATTHYKKDIIRENFPTKDTMYMSEHEYEQYLEVTAAKTEKSYLEKTLPIVEIKKKEVAFSFTDNAIKILDIFKAAGREAFLVGGCVRDAILGRESHDEDIATECTPDEVKEILINTGISANRIIDTGLQHGTITVMLPDENEKLVGYEITTYRADGEYENSHKPKEVTFISSFLEDTKRRDFTINAMGFADGSIVDYHNGLQDAENKIIRTVGNPIDRFGEDALRMMRAVRFSSQLGFNIAPEIEAAILGENPKNPGHKMYEKMSEISAERIFAELTKVLLSPNPGKGFELLCKWHLLDTISPYFYKMFEIEQNHPYHIYNVGMHACKVIDNVPPILEVRLAAALHDIGKAYPGIKVEKNGQDSFVGHDMKSVEIARTILQPVKGTPEKEGARSLKCPTDVMKVTLLLISNHENRLPAQNDKIANFIVSQGKDFTPNEMHYLLLLQRGDSWGQNQNVQGNRIEIFDSVEMIADEIMAGPYLDKDLSINANDIVKITVAENGCPIHFDYPDVPAVRKELLKFVMMNPEKNNTYDLCEFIRSNGKQLQTMALSQNKVLKESEKELIRVQRAARTKFEKELKKVIYQNETSGFMNALNAAKKAGVLTSEELNVINN